MVTVNDGTCEQVKVAFTGVSATPFRDKGLEQLIEGTEVDPDSLADACKSAASGIDVMSDHFASQEYRLHLAGVYAKRALITLTR
jgi:carbon-monoxide dehydrogenase medium subunit